MAETPFGKVEGTGGMLQVLREPPAPVMKWSDFEIHKYITIVITALNNKVSNETFKPQSLTHTHTDFAHVTLFEQGLRLLILERIMVSRRLKPSSEMAQWLAVVKKFDPIRDELRKANINLI